MTSRDKYEMSGGEKRWTWACAEASTCTNRGAHKHKLFSFYPNLDKTKLSENASLFSLIFFPFLPIPLRKWRKRFFPFLPFFPVFSSRKHTIKSLFSSQRMSYTHSRRLDSLVTNLHNVGSQSVVST